MTTTLYTYYTNIKALIEDDKFSIKAQAHFVNKEDLTSKEKKEAFREQCRANSHTESINYLMWEFWHDRDDPRAMKYFHYVCKPNGVNDPNNTDKDGNVLDIDFCKWEPEKFIKEVMTLKIRR